MNKDKFNTLKDMDIYSLSLFVLYKLTDIPEYSINGELPYILDKTSLLNFCNFFGGQTIKVPTLSELYSVINVVLLYQYTKIEGIDYDKAIEMLNFDKSQNKNIKISYNKLCAILEKYNFGR